jgi:hypothetical protein
MAEAKERSAQHQQPVAAEAQPRAETGAPKGQGRAFEDNRGPAPGKADSEGRTVKSAAWGRCPEHGLGYCSTAPEGDRRESARHTI